MTEFWMDKTDPVVYIKSLAMKLMDGWMDKTNKCQYKVFHAMTLKSQDKILNHKDYKRKMALYATTTSGL